MTITTNNYANSTPTTTKTDTKTNSSTTKTTDTSSALSSLSQNYTSFLKMLTTQLQNQDPTKPMDANEMTNQLVQYANVEQNISTNTKLDKLITLQQQGTSSTNLAYLGRTIIYKGDEFSYTDTTKSATLSYELESSAKKVRVDILDSKDRIIRSMDGETSAGTKHIVTWDGKDASGNTVQAGTYRINIAPTAQQADTTIKATTYTFGTVSGVQYDKSGEMQLIANELAIPVSDITSVH